MNRKNPAKNNEPEQMADIPAMSRSEITQMDFRWGNEGAFAPVTLPHTVNAENGTGMLPLLRGDGYYRCNLNITKEDLSSCYLLQFEQAGQRADVFLNGNLIHKNFSGYTPFAVCLNDLKAGCNEIMVHTENRLDKECIPNDADFNFCNGIYGKLFLMRAQVYFDPAAYGIDRFHVIPRKIGGKKACFSIAANVFNSRDLFTASVQVTVKDAEGKTIVEESIPFILSHGGNEFRRDFSFDDPVLWNGMENPYLYDVEIAVRCGEKIIDSAAVKYGFRDLSLPGKPGDHHLRLNGKEVVLRGVALHQDIAGHAAAMTDEDRSRDQEIIRDLGCNWLRCAHYPHNVSEFCAYDRMGLMCQTEIPWVNTFALGTDFEERVEQYAKDMINNLFNHPCIVLWGVSNELDYKTVDPSFLDLHNRMIRLVRQLDPSRFSGFVTHLPRIAADNGLIADWYGVNTYPGWYSSNTFEEVPDVLAATRHVAKFYLHGISEYGYGGNPVHHNSEFMTVYESDKNTSGTSLGRGGVLHPEEYQTLAHIYEWNRIAGTEEGKNLTFTSIWILFDFAVDQRMEGQLPGINDKGLVTRDRKIKKDSYYFYKCVWNPAPEVHIMSSRWKVRDTPQIAITVFSNGDQVELYRNGEKIQTLTQPTDEVNRVVWNFDAVSFTEAAKHGTPDVFKAIGYRNGKVIAEDTASFSTEIKREN